MNILNDTVAKTFGLKVVNGMFGIEIELEGDLPLAAPAGWQAKEDGSLRHGIEYVSKPIDRIAHHVSVLQTYLKATSARIEPSYRCSTHIHTNFTGRRWRDVLGTMIVWAMAEPLFLKQMPPGRDGSLFCLSSYDTGDLPLYFANLCEELRHGFNRHGMINRGKYSALNVTRLRDLGTLEFRIFPPSVEPEEIAKWCRWLKNLIGVAEKMVPEDWPMFINHCQQRPQEFAESIFEGRVNFEGLSDYVDMGCHTAFELARVLNVSIKKKETQTKTKKPAIDGMNADLAFLDDDF